MPSARKPSLILPVAVAVLLGLYVGAYYATADSEIVSTVGVPGNFPPMWQPTYSIGNLEFDGWFFAPVHWIDRRIRPEVWPE